MAPSKGVRCDVPSHVYQTSFEPKTDWSEKYAAGAEILDCWQTAARKYNIYEHTKLNHRVDKLVWDERETVWALQVTNLPSEDVLDLKFDFVLTATGRFNSWRLPDYSGLSDYKGALRHVSNWNLNFDPKDKKVALIGNGASGIQLTTNLQRVERHYIRQPTWIAAAVAGDERTLDSQPYSDAQKEAFKDSSVYLKFRKELESNWRGSFNTFVKGTQEVTESREQLLSIMRERLSKRPELVENLVPGFSPFCRRLTPGPGYLEALTEHNVEVIYSTIKRFTEMGIETVDGVHREVDAIFGATGANVDLAPPFAIQANELDLRSDWLPGGRFGFPYSYLGLATPGFPNLLFIYGPNPQGLSGSLPHSLENQLTYYAKLLRKVPREGIKTIVPCKKAADEFIDYTQALFNTTVFSENCRSWYNSATPGSFIHGLWPGSGLHCVIARREPRWEDWEYTYLSSSGNRFAWYFGNGQTRAENKNRPGSGLDLTPYLRVPSQMDLKEIQENWWSVP